MVQLTDITGYAEAHRHFSKDALWDLFDGDRAQLNIGHECVDRHEPERTAIRVARDDGTYESATFGELRDWSNRFANWLIADGIQKGDRIAIMLEPSLTFYLSLYGAMKMGAVAVPLFTLFGPDGLQLRIQDCDPKFLLTTEDLANGARLEETVRTVLVDDGFFKSLETQSASFNPDTSANDMAMYQYTSGTTRELPEAVKHRHRAIVTVIIAALYATGVRPGDRYMCPSSPAWGHGLWHGTLAPMAIGVEIASYAGRFDAKTLFNAVQEMGITNMSAAATHYRMMKIAGCGPVSDSRIEKLSFTGEPIDRDTETWVKQTFGIPVCSIYGTTEVGVVLASYPGAIDFDVRPGALGKPVPGVVLDIHDANGQSCAVGQVGEIMLKRRNGWFSIKDLGHRDKDGYWWHDGRADDVIISAGWTMSAKEIEDTLLAHADVDEAAAIAVPDDERGQVAKAFIVSPRPADDAFASELQEFTKERLARHEYPRRIEFADSLPKTPAGKVNRKMLRDLEAKRKDETV
jgi:acetyl-CoA synthetase